MVNTKRLVTREQLGEILGMTEERITRRIKSGLIPTVSLGAGKIRIPLDKALEQLGIDPEYLQEELEGAL